MIGPHGDTSRSSWLDGTSKLRSKSRDSAGLWREVPADSELHQVAVRALRPQRVEPMFRYATTFTGRGPLVAPFRILGYGRVKMVEWQRRPRSCLAGTRNRQAPSTCLRQRRSECGLWEPCSLGGLRIVRSHLSAFQRAVRSASVPCRWHRHHCDRKLVGEPQMGRGAVARWRLCIRYSGHWQCHPSGATSPAVAQRQLDSAQRRHARSQHHDGRQLLFPLALSVTSFATCGNAQFPLGSLRSKIRCSCFSRLSKAEAEAR